MRSWQVKSLQELSEVVAEVLAYCEPYRFLVFYGGMGTGKTTFIKALCTQLGVTEEVASPTYSLVNEYVLPANNLASKVFHMDLYRLQSIEEALDIGIEDYLTDTDAWCLVEWPGLVEDLLPDHVVILRLEQTDNHKRLITVKLPVDK